MDEAQTYALVMYSLVGASQSTPASFSAISQVADGINHAVPTHKEIQWSLKWLMGNGIVQKQGSGYLLTEMGPQSQPQHEPAKAPLLMYGLPSQVLLALALSKL